MAEPTRKLAAIMFTDIAGFTALSASDADKAVRLIHTQREVLKPIVEEHAGTWLREVGDGLLLTFPTASSAVRCAIQMQQAVRAVEGLRLRIGIHEGEILEQAGDILGDAVNIASRLEPFAAPGGVALSDKVQQEIASYPEFTTTYLGRPKLKGVRQEVKVYCLTSHGLPETNLSEVSAKLETKTTPWVKYLIAAVVVVVAAGMYLTLTKGKVSEQGVAQAATTKPAVAVLYFEPMALDRESEVWAAGMTDAVITAVAKLGKLDVKSRTQVLPYKDQSIVFDRLRKQLKVDAFLEGSLQKVGPRVRVQAQLIDARSGNHLWAEQYDRPATDIFAVQDEISQAIAKALGVQLGTIQSDILAARPTENVRAFEWASQGIYYHDRKMYALALAAFDSALAIDPMYARAHYHTGRTYQAIKKYEEAINAYQKALPKAEQFSRTRWEWRNPQEGTIRWQFAPKQQLAFGMVQEEAKNQTQLYTIDLSRKEMIWKQTIPDAYTDLGQIRNNIVYVVSSRQLRTQAGEAAIFAYDLQTGDQLFRKIFPRKNPDDVVFLGFGPILDEREKKALPTDESKRPLLVATMNFMKRDKIEIYGLNPKNGTTLWKFVHDELAGWSSLISSQDKEDLLLIEGRHPSLLKLTDGKMVWEMKLKDRQQLFVNQGQPISFFQDSTVVSCLRVPDKTQVWTYKTEAPIKQVVNLSKNGLLILQLAGGKLVALDTGRLWFGFGRVKWKADLGNGTYQFRYKTPFDPFLSGVDIFSSETVKRLYAFSQTGVISVLDVQSGKILGKTETNLDNAKLRVLDKAVIGISSTHLFRVDANTGTLLWKARDPHPPEEYAPMYVTEGKLLIGKPDLNLVSVYDLQYGNLLLNYRHDADFWGSMVKPEKTEQLFLGMKKRLVELNLQENPEEKLIQEKEVLVNLAQCATELQRYEEATGYLTEVVETLDPGYALAYKSLADLYDKSKKPKDAVRALVDYHTLVPSESPEALATVEQFKRSAGLLWRSDIDASSGDGVIDKTRLFTGGWNWGSNVDLSALDRQTGALVWKKPFFNNIRISDWEYGQVEQDGEDLFVLSLDKPDNPNLILTSVQKTTGRTNWQTTLLPTDAPGIGLKRLHKGYMYLAGEWPDKKIIFLKVFDSSTGQQVWEQSWPADKGIRRWAFYESTLAIGFKNSIQFLDTRSGKLLWTYSTGNIELTGEMTKLEHNGIPDGRLVFTTLDNHYHCLDLNTRKKLWSFRSPVIEQGYYAGFGAMQTAGDTMFDFARVGGKVFAFTYDAKAPGNVRLIWNIALGNRFAGITDERQFIYVTTPEKTLLKINKSTGTIEKEYPLLWDGFPQIRDNVAYIGSNRYVYAMKLE